MSRSFQSQDAWLNHELCEHRWQWECPECGNVFEFTKAIHTHLNEAHPDVFAKSQHCGIIRQFRRPAECFRLQDCSFCEEPTLLEHQIPGEGLKMMDAKQFQLHLAHHISSIEVLMETTERMKDMVLNPSFENTAFTPMRSTTTFQTSPKPQIYETAESISPHKLGVPNEAKPGVAFDFLQHAQAHKCRSRKVSHTLVKEGEFKNNDKDQYVQASHGMLFTPEVLQKVLSKKNVAHVLACRCKICEELTEQTSRDDDMQLAANVENSNPYQILFAALALIGGTFAVRRLYKGNLITIDDVLRTIPKRKDIQEDLFRPLLTNCGQAKCEQLDKLRFNHSDDTLEFFSEKFVSQLQSAAWILRVPHFQANNLLRRFNERQNMPFINEERLSLRKPGEGRQYFRFEIHPKYCDEKLNVC
jgi:hypothetical protein